MDVEGPGAEASIQFNSDNTARKGKRIVADLPIEAEDNLPWSAQPSLLEHTDIDHTKG